MIGPSTATNDRGQAHTVEAFIAALLLISGLLFAMQATAVTPLSASTSNQHIENQQRAVAHDLLSTAAEDGTLHEGILYWNATGGTFQNSSEAGYYTSANSENPFLESLNHTLGERRIAYNVRIRSHNTTGTPSTRTTTMVQMGQPSDNAVTASQTVTVYNTDRLTGEDDCQLVDCASFYARNTDGDSQLYNRLEVRITTWRM